MEYLQLVLSPLKLPSFFHFSYKPLLLISLSGFRADYLMRNFTPTIKRLSECGVYAPYMRAVYPTKTYPNHYTIVTVISHLLHLLIYASLCNYYWLCERLLYMMAQRHIVLNGILKLLLEQCKEAIPT